MCGARRIAKPEHPADWRMSQCCATPGAALVHAGVHASFVRAGASSLNRSRGAQAACCHRSHARRRSSPKAESAPPPPAADPLAPSHSPSTLSLDTAPPHRSHAPRPRQPRGGTRPGKRSAAAPPAAARPRRPATPWHAVASASQGHASASVRHARVVRVAAASGGVAAVVAAVAHATHAILKGAAVE